MTEYYRQFIEQAAQLFPSECVRMADIAIKNKCRCNDCFTCACALVVWKREQEGLL